MNTAVLYAKTFGKYKREKCPDTANKTCIHKIFDGQDYFDNYILNTKGKKGAKILKSNAICFRLEITLWKKQNWS